MGDAFLEIAIGDDGVDAVIEENVVRGVEEGGEVFLGDGEADGVARALAERTGGHFDAGRLMGFRMSGGDGMKLTEFLDLLHGDFRKSGEVEERVDEHGAVASGEDETIAVGPLRIGGVVAEKLCPKNGGEIGAAHGEAGMARVSFFYGIDGEDADCVGDQIFDGSCGEGGGFGIHEVG